MSSLTSLGVNKNKKGFAPKLNKRKDRKERKIPIDPKNEPLTEEEMAINAAAATRTRRRRSHEQPSSSNPRAVKAASPITAPSPISSPSPMALYCDIERGRKERTFLKIERMTPDANNKLDGMTEEPRHFTTDDDNDDDDDTSKEVLVPIRKESVAPKLDNIVPKVDLDDDNMDFTSLLASGGKENHVRSARKRKLPRVSKASASIRLRATTEVDSDVLKEEEEEQEKEEQEEEEEENEAQTKPAPKKRKITASKAKAKGKGKEKEKPLAKKKARSKDSKKGEATAISIGIGVPTASSSTASVPSESVEADEEEEYSDEDSDGNRIVKIRKKKNSSRKKQYKYAYRLVENMRTLDDITIDPASADNLDKPMSDFIKDIDGIVSKTYKEMEVQRSQGKKKAEERSKLSAEELEALKKKEAEEERIAKEKKEASKAKDEERRRKELDGQILAESSNALQVRLVNGQIVLDTDSLVVERTEGGNNYGDDPMEIVEESSLTKKVNSATYGKRKQSARWDELETASFYDCLSQFGTDFEMIATMMPGRNRNQIRTKFNREERTCPEKVTEYMITKRKLMDLDKYTQMAGIELEAVPDDFHEMQLA